MAPPGTTIILLAEIFVSTCVVLGVALVSESQAWTISALIAGNLFCNFFIFSLSRIPAIAAAAKGNVIVWMRRFSLCSAKPPPSSSRSGSPSCCKIARPTSSEALT